MLALALRNLGLSVYFGGGLAVMFGTRAIFAAADSRKQGGHFSGAVLSAFSFLRALALFALVAADMSGPRRHGEVTSFLVVTVLSLLVDSRIRKLRDQVGGSTEGLDAADPRRKRFGMLHGVSVLLLLAQVALAGVWLAVQ